MFNYYRKDNRTERERDLEDQLERERQDRQDQDRRNDEEREQQRKQRQTEREQEYRYASDWPEAFQKQASLCWREQNMFPEQNDEDQYFGNTAKANEEALKIWNRLYPDYKEQIDTIMEKLRLAVADQLEASNELSEFKQTAQAIRDDELSSYLDW